VASVEDAEPTTAWREASEDVQPEVEAPVEAVASVQDAEPTNAWWEASEDAEPEVEAPVEAFASVEDVEPGAETPLEAVASVAEPAEPGKAWWEKAADEPADGATGPETSNADDDDDPWADFMSRPAADQPQPITTAPTTWSAALSAPRDEDMWGDVAASAEEAAHTAHDIDLAASLESQMAQEAEPEPAFAWSRASDDEDSWDAAPAVEAAPPAAIEDDEDVILAAFERHAATPESAEAKREQDEQFTELLGEQAADIVAEASEEDGGRSFIRMSGWAPQRGASDFDGGWAPEQEVEDTLARNQRPYNFGGIDGDGFSPPSWAVDEMEPDEVPVPRRGHKTKTWIREIVETGLLAFLVFLSVRASFQNFKVEGSSMSPTLEDGQFLIVNKLVYSEVDLDKLGKFIPFVDGGNDPERNVFHGPERGDIVVLIDPRNPDTDLIKRVIGLPGETVEIVNGHVYINDRLLEEPYIESEWHDNRPKIVVPPDEYFVMGDNRDNSLDSRNPQVSTVPKDLIIGKAMLSYWPSSKFGLAPNASPGLTDEKPVLTSKRLDEDR
jgi:signal peptidase I